MKWLLLLLSFSAYALPPCYPGEATADSMIPTLVADDQQNCAAVWFCDVGHKWQKWAFWGHGDNVDNCAYGYTKAVAALFVTHAQKDALWNERFVTGAETDPVKRAQYEAQDAPALAMANAVPAPIKVPPSGLVTQDVRVYQMTGPTNATPVFSLIGTVQKGVACDSSQRIAGLYRVDRAMVTFQKGVIMPKYTFANCDP